MKTMMTLVNRALRGAGFVGLGLALAARAAEPTAFELAKEGNRYVGEESKDNLVQIRSEKSLGSTTPNVWYIVYYDPGATLKATEVKFEAGKKVSVKRPLRLLEPATGGDVAMPRDRLKVDSDQAIKTVTKDPMLQNVTVTATELKLQRAAEGLLGVAQTGDPVWIVKLWATKLKDSARGVEVGQVFVDAADGKIVKSDLHLNKIDW